MATCRGRAGALAAALAFALAAPAGAQADADIARSAPDWDTLTDRLIVRWRAPAGAAATAPDASARAHEAAHRLGIQMQALRRTAQGATVMQLDRALPQAAAERLARALAAADPAIELALPDRRVVIQFTPDDPRYNDQWHYFEPAGGINLPGAWALSTGAGVVVAVLDTGVRPHPDLAAQLLPGPDFIGDLRSAADGDGRDGDASDPGDGVAAGECGPGQPAKASSWHGTHVSGTVAATTGNGVGVAGVAFGARILPARVLGKCGGYASDITDAITWASGGAVPGVPAAPQRAQVINLSLAGFGLCDTTMAAAIAGARSRGALVVAAAANAASDAGNYFPANCPGVVAVAAVNRTGGRASYSNVGTVVDLAAPGGEGGATVPGRVLSTSNNGTTTPGADVYGGKQGTSMAAPHVSGVAALMRAALPLATVESLEAVLVATARPFPAPCAGCGSGIVDAEAAVRAVTAGQPPTVAETESNNTRSRAQRLASVPVQVAGRMDTASDTDFYRLALPAGRTLNVRLQPVPGSDPNLLLMDANGLTLARSTLGAGLLDQVAWRNAGTAPVDLFVRVRWASGGFGPGAGDYLLGLAASAP
jgi:serine protease